MKTIYIKALVTTLGLIAFPIIVSLLGLYLLPRFQLQLYTQQDLYTALVITTNCFIWIVKATLLLLFFKNTLKKTDNHLLLSYGAITLGLIEIATIISNKSILYPALSLTALSYNTWTFQIIRIILRIIVQATLLVFLHSTFSQKILISKKKIGIYTIIIILMMPISTAIVQWKITLAITKQMPDCLRSSVTKIVDAMPPLRMLRYEYTKWTLELPKSPISSTLEIDPQTSLIRYTDKTSELSFLFPDEWHIDTWDGTDPERWTEKKDSGMSWEWFYSTAFDTTKYRFLTIRKKGNGFYSRPYMTIDIVKDHKYINKSQFIELHKDQQPPDTIFDRMTTDRECHFFEEWCQKSVALKNKHGTFIVTLFLSDNKNDMLEAKQILNSLKLETEPVETSYSTYTRMNPGPLSGEVYTFNNGNVRYKMSLPTEMKDKTEIYFYDENDKHNLFSLSMYDRNFSVIGQNEYYKTVLPALLDAKNGTSIKISQPASTNGYTLYTKKHMNSDMLGKSVVVHYEQHLENSENNQGYIFTITKYFNDGNVHELRLTALTSPVEQYEQLFYEIVGSYVLSLRDRL